MSGLLSLPVMRFVFCPLLLALYSMAGGISVAEAAGTGRPVLLREEPHSAFDQAARSLNSDLLRDAESHDDTVIVLVGRAALNSGKKDMALFVQLQSARLCGAARCTTSVYLKQGHDWVTVIDSVNGDISVLHTRHHGYYDLMVGDDDRWIWNGTTYQDTAR